MELSVERLPLVFISVFIFNFFVLKFFHLNVVFNFYYFANLNLNKNLRFNFYFLEIGEFIKIEGIYGKRRMSMK